MSSFLEKMGISKKIALILISFILVPLSKIYPAEYPPSGRQNQKHDGASLKERNKLINLKRDKYVKTDEVLKILKIKPGMTILDIGAGLGYFSYKFAEELKGTGMVFATEIAPERVNYMIEEAKRMGITNIAPVVVKKEGVDEFYGKHKYDLIFLSNTYARIIDRVNYFKKIKNFLTEDGRLIIVQLNPCYLFSLYCFNDFEKLIDELSLDPKSKPFYENLRESTRQLIKLKVRGKLDAVLKNAVIDDFNKILLDPNFYTNFLESTNLAVKPLVKGSFNKAEWEFVNWLVMLLKEDGAFDKPEKDLNAKEIRAIKKINWLFFTQRFRKYLLPLDTEHYLKENDLKLQTSEFLIIKELTEAGYQLESNYNSSALYIILAFTEKK